MAKSVLIITPRNEIFAKALATILNQENIETRIHSIHTAVQAAIEKFDAVIITTGINAGYDWTHNIRPRAIKAGIPTIMFSVEADIFRDLADCVLYKSLPPEKIVQQIISVMKR